MKRLGCMGCGCDFARVNCDKIKCENVMNARPNGKPSQMMHVKTPDTKNIILFDPGVSIKDFHQ